MTLHRRNPKRDANETDIVSALERMGFHVERLSGAGLPDLLLSRANAWHVAEVKSRRGRLTAEQEQFRDRARAAVPVFRDVVDAITWAGRRP